LAMQEVSADNTIRQSQTEFETFIESSDFANNGVNEPLLLGSIVSSVPAMDAVAGSQTAMDAVAGSQTAMDAVAASQTAMDAVIASQLALDTVVASQTAMDAVAASQTAMDAVAASQTAMDAVAGGILARTKVLSSEFVNSLWNQEYWAQQIIDNSNLTSGDTNIIATTILDNTWGINLTPDGNLGSQGTESVLTFEINADDYSTLELDTVYNDDGANCIGMLVQLGNSELVINSLHSRTNRTLDISNETGVVELKLGFRETAGCSDFGNNADADFYEINLN